MDLFFFFFFKLKMINTILLNGINLFKVGSRIGMIVGFFGMNEKNLKINEIKNENDNLIISLINGVCIWSLNKVINMYFTSLIFGLGFSILSLATPLIYLLFDE